MDDASLSPLTLCLSPYLTPPQAMLLVIDNYDSFTYNLVQYFGALGVEQRVFRNDKITAAEAASLQPSRILISPGPCTPNEAGVSIPMIEAFAGKVPILGVCLGHQSIGQHFGGKVIRADRLMHGKTSTITHIGEGLFENLPEKLETARYHSLIVERESFPDCLEIAAETEEGEIMACRHKEHPIWGLQFHPESIATQNGMDLLKNFLSL